MPNTGERVQVWVLMGVGREESEVMLVLSWPALRRCLREAAIAGALQI